LSRTEPLWQPPGVPYCPVRLSVPTGLASGALFNYVVANRIGATGAFRRDGGGRGAGSTPGPPG